MKKFFDKHVAQSYKGQVVTLAIAFLVMIVTGGFVGRWVLDEKDENTAKFGNRATWGLMQCVDGGFVDATITSNTKLDDGKITENAPLGVVAVSLGFWLFGMVLVSFFTGAATEFLSSRRDKILHGDVDYRFDGNYVLIVGCDFQVKNLIRGLMAKSRADIVLVTESDVAAIYEDILPELEGGDRRRLFVMRKDIAVEETYGRMALAGAEAIYLIGDGGAVGRDGKTLRALDEITKKGRGEAQRKGRGPVKTYVHIEDSVLYAQVRAMELPPDGCPLFDLEVYNYYESWAWKCWADKGATDGRDGAGDAYLPLRFRMGTKHSELFVIGAGRMGRAMVNFAMPLMNYGGNGKHCKITVFDADPLKKGFLPDQETLDNLPEAEVRYSTLDGCSDEANGIMLEAAQKEDTSVTVVVAISDPGKALRAYTELSNRLRRCEVSVLVWQATHSKYCPDKKCLKMGGAGSSADKTRLRYFGMTDLLPWQETSRFECGMAVNFFYNTWFPHGKEAPVSPAATAAGFVEAAKAVWNAAGAREEAEKQWQATKRWKKWSSVNSGDTFREKAVLFEGAPHGEAAQTTLKAEHNRWWTERLLAGWQYAASRDDAQMAHDNMVKFENLPDEVKDKDKINIAAMAAFGFI
jgi:hypothetical protein